MITKEHTVFCQGKCCGDWLQLPIGVKAQFISQIKKYGWKFSCGNWRCPRCAPATKVLTETGKTWEDYRMRNGMNQKEISELFGITDTSYRRIIYENDNMRAKLFNKIQSIMGAR